MPFVDQYGLPCPPPALRPDGPSHFVLTEDARYVGREDDWPIEEGFRTDGASIPHLLRWFIDRFGAHTAAALVHDKLCDLIRKRRTRITRRDADGVFRRILREEKVEWHVRWLMWAAVRVGCGFEGGMSGKEALQLLACLPAGLLLVVLSLGPLLGRCLSRVAGWLGPKD